MGCERVEVSTPVRPAVPGRGSEPDDARPGELSAPAPGRVDDVVQTAARQGALGLAGAVLAGLGGLVLTIVVSRMLPAAEAGVYFTSVAAFTITATVLVLGSDTGLVRSLAGARAAGRPELLRPYLRVVLAPVTVAAAGVSLTVWLFAEPLSRIVFAGAEQALMAQAMRLLAPFLLAATLSVVLLNGASRGLGTLRTFTAVQQIFLPGVRPVLVGAVLVGAGAVWGAGGRTAQLALLAWAAPLLVALVVAARAVHHRLPDAAATSAGVVVPDHLGRRFWRATAPRGLAATFEVLIVWSDVVLVTALLGPVRGGIYAAASRFVTSGSFALQAVRLSVGPLLAGAFARGDVEQAAQVHRLSIRWAILSTWPVYLAMGAFAPGVLALLGPDYAEAAGALSVLCLAMLGVVATGNANTVLNMAHRSHWAAANTALATVLMLGLDLLLVPRIGILGAAVGWSAAMLTDAALSTLEVRLGLGLHSADASVAQVVAVVLTCFAVPVLAVRLATDGLRVPAPVVLFAGTAGCAALYAAVLYAARRRLALDVLVSALRRRRPGPTRRPTAPDPTGGR